MNNEDKRYIESGKEGMKAKGLDSSPCFNCRFFFLNRGRGKPLMGPYRCKKMSRAEQQKYCHPDVKECPFFEKGEWGIFGRNEEDVFVADY